MIGLYLTVILLSGYHLQTLELNSQILKRYFAFECAANKLSLTYL